MKCLSCKRGKPKKEHTTFATERDGVLAVVRHVPALVCDSCGEKYFDDRVAKVLYKQVEHLIRSGKGIGIQEFKAA